MVNPIQNSRLNQTPDKQSKKRMPKRQPIVVVGTSQFIIKWDLQQTVALKVFEESQAPETQGAFGPDDTAHPHTEQFRDLGQQVSTAHGICHLAVELCYSAIQHTPRCS